MTATAVPTALDARFDGDTELDCMSVEQLRAALAGVHALLYEEGPDTEWSGETASNIANLLADSGLGPPCPACRLRASLRRSL